ncbi:MAG: hypothetical protein C0594_05510 [Marinilabiliales bacterium]|mgnify:CR=1 FL=1|nr:MAG: hypothetical protein C0594_05510 [Marinilabiliales bacterium]
MKTKALILILVMSFSISAIANTGSIKGRVIDSKTQDVIEFAQIQLIKNSKLVAKTSSDVMGEFTFTSIPVGRYSLKVVANGYQDYKSLEIIVTTTNRTLIEIKLQPEKIVLEELVDEIELEECMSVSCDRKKESRAMGGTKVKCAAPATGFYMNNQSYDNSWNQPVHNTEEYDEINETGFLAALSNPLSTFSVDVDRAAYSNIRRFLNSNQMPHKDVARIEEMINYFDYDYSAPKGDIPFSVNMEMASCPWNTNHQLLHVGLQGKELEQEEVPATNLVFLLDVSGSMNAPNKLPLLKSAFKILVDKLRPEDRVAIVVYAGAAGCVLESTSGADKTKIVSALDKLSAGGSTAGGEGIKLAYKIAKQSFIKDGNNRVILATDGDFNIGASSDAEMVRLIENKRDDGIFLTVLGFGMGNYKDSKMEKISNAGNGNYAYIDNILEAKKTLGEEIWGTLFTIAKDVKIQIEFNPAKVKAYRLIGYENRMLKKEDFNDDTKDAGEIGAGHTVTALYEIIPADSEEKVGDSDDLIYQTSTVKASNDLMTLKLRYKEPDGDVSKLIEEKVSEKDVKTRGMTSNFQFSAAVAEFGLLLRDSEFKANASYNQVLDLARSSKGEDRSGYRAEFIKLVEVAQILHDTASK